VILAATMRRPHLQWNRWRQRATQARLGSLIALAWAVVVLIVGLLVTGTWWLMGAPALDFPDTLPPRAVDTLATRAFAVVAGFGAAALLVIHYRRQRTTEADAERAEQASKREVTKLFNERFTSAYTELGSEHAAVRLGAVHALAHLADDAPSEREVQMVIDVLCAYLRMPYTPRPDGPSEQPTLPPAPSTTTAGLDQPRGIGHDDAQRERQQAAQEEHGRRVLEFESFQQVRHTIIRLIGNRLRADTRWRGKDYDFHGVVFDGGDLSRAWFTGGAVIFSGAHFTRGRVDFGGAHFAGGRVDFNSARFTGGAVIFSGAHFTGGRVDFGRTLFTSGRVVFGRAWFADGTVDFGGAHFTGGRLTFGGAHFVGGRLTFGGAHFVGGRLTFGGARFNGGRVLFGGAHFTDGRVDFGGARFTDGIVGFSGAEFIGGAVDFSRALFSRGRVTFPEAEFTGGAVDFSRALFTRDRVTFPEAEFTGGAVDFGWGGFVGDLDDFERARGVCPVDLKEAQAQLVPGVLLFPEAWGHRPRQEDSEALVTEQPAPNSPDDKAPER
jgi:uncharacterized protein YjbI with pentapeptide repeats